jgi:hypothetical protein
MLANKNKSIVTLLAAVVVAGCTPSPKGTLFVGTWEATTKSPWTGQLRTVRIEFAREGKSIYLVDGGNKYPATASDNNTLSVSTPLAPSPVVFSYSRETGKIISMGDEFTKVSHID